MTYGNELKHLIPVRRKRYADTVPGNDVGLFNYISMVWLTRLNWKAFRRGLELTDLWNIAEEDSCKLATERFERLWEEEKLKSAKKDIHPEVWRAAWTFVRTRTFVALFVSVFAFLLSVVGPAVLMKLMLDYINDPLIDNTYAAVIVTVAFIVNFGRGCLINATCVIGVHTGIRLIGAAQGLLYRKIMRLKTGGEKISAQIINIVNNDMERIFEAVVSCSFLMATPVAFIANSIYAVYIIGPWGLLGVGVYVLFYPVMGCIARFQSGIRVRTVKETDKRVAMMGEIIESIQLIKMYSWEKAFSQKIADVRKLELGFHKKAALLQAVTSTVTPSIGLLATMVTFMACTLAGNDLTAAEAFTVFSVLISMQYTAAVLPYTIRSIGEGKVCFGRIQKIMSLPDHCQDISTLVNNNLSLQIKNASFAWEEMAIELKAATNDENRKEDKSKRKKKAKENEKREVNHEVIQDGEASKELLGEKQNVTETLFSIDLSIETGKLIGICGPVGSGKSSLLHAICGDLLKQSGKVMVNGSLALVTQQAWIYNGTVIENICVGDTIDEARYMEVLDSCCLHPDLQMLPNQDQTEIGERGVNLSGGQKQRISLARAVYSNRDIYLLDDPLSAVDAKVARKIFQFCIKNMLRDKTVLMVSHGVQFLEECDELIFLNDGRITEKGTHDELIALKGGYYDMMVHTAVSDKPSDIRKMTLEGDGDIHKGIGAPKDDAKLISEETKGTGDIQSRIYFAFIKVCGGWSKVGLVLLAILLFTLCRIFSILWIQIWFDNGDGMIEERKENATLYNLTLSDSDLRGYVTDNPDLWLYQLVYLLSFVVLFGTGLVKGIGVAFCVLGGSSRLHGLMFDRILRSPMSFFHTTLTGRILNRFSRDLDELDVRVPFFVEFVLQGLMYVLAQMCLVSYLNPWFIIPIVTVLAIFIFIDILLKSGMREIKRLDNVLKSPVLQHIRASIAGISIIRTFNKEPLFTSRFYKSLDDHSAAYLIFRMSTRWFIFRMDMLGILVTQAVATICVFGKSYLSTAVAGLAIACISGISGFAPFLMRMKAEFQSRMTSVERIIEFAYELSSEAAVELNSDPKSGWPSKGAIKITDASLRYRPELPLVLHHINVDIPAGEKIGIVGRTGAGKSSLISSLLRLVELETGTIEIDGTDISQVGLHLLRSSISVIPQDPILFHGTIRYNLDPFDMHSDEALWKALEESHLKGIIEKLTHGLDSAVEAGGKNFSVGERQLICLTRALLRNSKILLLDEATASVDVETDHLIQETIRESFASCTVLTIAHRLHTILGYNRIIVMENGKVAEFDSPASLMETEGSLFREMMNTLGITSLDQLK